MKHQACGFMSCLTKNTMHGFAQQKCKVYPLVDPHPQVCASPEAVLLPKHPNIKRSTRFLSSDIHTQPPNEVCKEATDRRGDWQPGRRLALLAPPNPNPQKPHRAGKGTARRLPAGRERAASPPLADRTLGEHTHAAAASTRRSDGGRRRPPTPPTHPARSASGSSSPHAWIRESGWGKKKKGAAGPDVPIG